MVRYVCHYKLRVFKDNYPKKGIITYPEAIDETGSR